MSASSSYLQARHGIRPDAMHIFCIASAPEPQKIVDRLPWWLDQVLECCMTVQEADRAYGRGSKTRPRRFATFGDYIKDRIRYAEAPETAREVLDLLVRISRGIGHGQARSAATARVNRLLTATGNAAAERLRELLVQLDDPATY